MKTASTILLMATLFGLVYAAVVIVSPGAIAARTYMAKTGERLSEARNQDVVGTLLTETRHLGVFAFAVNVALLFILFSAFNKGAKWAWWAFLVTGLIAWGYGLVIESVEWDVVNLLGHFIGIVLWMFGLVIPFRAFFPKEPASDPLR